MATDIIARGMAANKADLIGGKVPAEQLPSYVDDVIEKPNYASLPNPGETGKIYITTNDNCTYRWTGSTYVLIGSSGTYRPFPNGEISGTLQQVVDAIMEFPDKKAGMAYLGSIRGACIASLGLGNAECTVSFMTDSIAVLSLSSSNIKPYHWEYNTASNDYIWKKWADVSGTYSGNDWQTVTINNVTKNIPAATVVDQSYDATSAHAQSGTAVAGALSTKLDATKCTYQATAPTAAISDGGVHIVYLNAEPATKYDGYIYLIAEE